MTDRNNLTNQQLAEEFAKEFHANKNWSPLDRNEWRAISMFAEWLDKRPSAEPGEERTAIDSPSEICPLIGCKRRDDHQHMVIEHSNRPAEPK